MKNNDSTEKVQQVHYNRDKLDSKVFTKMDKFDGEWKDGVSLSNRQFALRATMHSICGIGQRRRRPISLMWTRRLHTTSGMSAIGTALGSTRSRCSRGENACKSCTTPTSLELKHDAASRSATLPRLQKGACS